MNTTSTITSTVRDLAKTAAYYRKRCRLLSVYHEDWRTFYSSFQCYRDAAKTVASQLIRK